MSKELLLHLHCPYSSASPAPRPPTVGPAAGSEGIAAAGGLDSVGGCSFA